VAIGIGLPNTLPIDGPALVGWARRAEERGTTGDNSGEGYAAGRPEAWDAPDIPSDGRSYPSVD
jgi:hypothetical protein